MKIPSFIRVPERFRNRKTLLWGLVGLAVILIIIGIASAGGGNADGERLTVERHDVVEQVRVAGTVEASIVSDLGFETTGIVRSVNVKEGARVTQGQTLASLGLGTLSAELQAAKAALAIKQSEASNTSINLTAIQEKQDTLVQNAQIKLYSDGLIAEPNSDDYPQTPPVISGRYTGAAGTYKLIVKQGSQSGNTDLYVFGIEETNPVTISTTGPTPVGTHGLFVSFPDDIRTYKGTTWYVTIPNTKSASYAANFNAYQDAVRERQQTIEQAQSDVRNQTEGASIAQAQVAQAQAEVARIEALIAQRILRAPFTGTVTIVDIDPGESVTAGALAVSLISNDAFGVEVDLPEVDSVKVHIGDKVSIMLDAFGDTVFTGTVASVNRTETDVDGISVYKAKVAFDEQDPRIASGMTAEVTITTNEKADALAVPARAIRYRTDGTTYVTVEDASGKTQEVEVAAGLRGSDGFTEIVAGLSEGDTVIVPSATK